MLIAIVTQPLISNYGGLLQNWALQTVLKREYPGTEVITFDQVDSLTPFYIRIGSKIKSILTGRRQKYVPTKFDKFREANINATPKARSLNDFKKFDRHYVPDVYIVGSDQVWRPSMVFKLDANFLSFTKCKNKIAYAASFGVSVWEFSKPQTHRCKDLIKDFSAISVRETDGVHLCAQFLDCEACCVLDPTMLLNVDDYKNLIPDMPHKPEDYIFTYILDSDLNKRNIVKKLIGSLPERNAAHDIAGHMPSKRLSVEEWLSSISNSSKVICDSFHGAAFSIIFNKDFYVLGNNHRGNSRLNSLLTLYGLSDRMITTAVDAKTLPPIDWNKVNSRRQELVAESLSFIHSAL